MHCGREERVYQSLYQGAKNPAGTETFKRDGRAYQGRNCQP